MTALLKNVFEAAETKAAADQMVGLKSGKLFAVLDGWDADEVLAPCSPRPPPLASKGATSAAGGLAFSSVFVRPPLVVGCP